MAAELDIKARLDASALLDTLDAMGVAPKNPRVRSAVKAAARDIMNAGKSRRFRWGAGWTCCAAAESRPRWSGFCA